MQQEGKKAYKSNRTLVTGSIPTYNGTTNITASSETQTLQTNGKYMNSDITINALPAGSIVLIQHFYILLEILLQPMADVHLFIMKT